LSKRIVLLLGLKKLIAGRYPMPDNMLNEWHLNELSLEFILKMCGRLFKFEKIYHVPFPFLSYHRIVVLRAVK